MSFAPSLQHVSPVGAATIVLIAVACGGEAELPEPDVQLAFRQEGDIQLSEPLTIPAGDRGFALLVEVEGCAQVARLVGEDVWVAELEGGPSCRGCRERVAVVAGSGVIVLPPRPSSEADVELRFGRVDCDTLAPLPPDPAPGSASVRVKRLALPNLNPSIGPLTVPIAFRHRVGSPWSSSAASEALADAVAALFESADIDVLLVSSDSEADGPADLEWFEGRPEMLPTSSRPGTVEVVFGGCLERVHPVLGSRAILDGFVPRVPAMGTPGGAIYLSQQSCFSGRSIERSLDEQARLLAHELGHYLGLFHTVDPGGQDDRLPDTARDETLMAPSDVRARPTGLSPLQTQRLRLHAALLPELRKS